MEVFAILVVLGLQVGLVTAIVLGVARFMTRTEPGRRLADWAWGGRRDAALSQDLVDEVDRLRAELSDLQERFDVAQRIVSRLSHAHPLPPGEPPADRETP